MKNILAKQNGPEVTENLVKYQQSLKERSKQLKEMVGEISHFQSQAMEYKFEIERIDAAIGQTKEHYFKVRRQQQQMGIIPEMAGNEEDDAEAYAQQQQQQQQYLMQQQAASQQQQEAAMAAQQPGGQIPPGTQELDPDDVPI